ncbi:hypothetical protein [Rhodopirellula sp. MGV]|uniref:RipA family octameric membrane protein n=1 Tax=Rhodopirellula sp. MGV TaxID=2023130 RepID=UPI000B96A36D|nr:hypothetical protein [Rhodopirellula sp. MGV]PNY35782.1 hypothetical protein C2E31_16245 [Rhodopirellula baltica]
MNSNERTELRQYAWAYFDRHAEQRLKTFNFYLVLAGAVIAGVMTFKNDFAQAWPLLFLLAFVSFVFWKLDCRNRVLTKHSEEALKTLEDAMDLADECDGVPHRCKLFRREEYESSKSLRYPGTPLASAAFSYTHCFNSLFILFGFGSAILACGLILANLRSENDPEKKSTGAAVSINALPSD